MDTIASTVTASESTPSELLTPEKLIKNLRRGIAPRRPPLTNSECFDILTRFLKYRTFCPHCATCPYPTFESLKGKYREGWEEATGFAGLVRRCASCRAAVPYTILKTVNPEKLYAAMRQLDETNKIWSADDLIGLVK